MRAGFTCLKPFHKVEFYTFVQSEICSGEAMTYELSRKIMSQCTALKNIVQVQRVLYSFGKFCIWSMSFVQVQWSSAGVKFTYTKHPEFAQNFSIQIYIYNSPNLYKTQFHLFKTLRACTKLNYTFTKFYRSVHNSVNL